MPKFDGTGPRGLGPMSGKGSGYCALKLPNTIDEPLVGVAGREGRPVTISSRDRSLTYVRQQMLSVQNALRQITRRIHALDSREGLK